MARPGILSRLAKDRKASVLPIMAAVMVPLIGIIGSGLDLSRAYLAKAKLQTACDAAALATRRHMSSGVTLSTDSIAEGQRFFSFNFPTGLMNTAPVTPAIALSTTDLSVVEVSATAQVPTTLMRVFGKYTMPVTASCSADQDFVNNDIMLVLDVTASMNCVAGTGTSCAFAAAEPANAISRLDRLRGAAASLYRALAGATGVRTRYGFMPYSMTVNVGASLPTGSMRNPATYHRCTAMSGGNCTGYGTDTALTRNSGWTPASMAPWNGCIEERSDIGRSAWPIAIGSTVTQADIDTGGTTDATRWQPYDNTVSLGASGVHPILARFCPNAASRLAAYGTEAAFQAQVEASLGRVGGYTNHDLGMVWALRFLSGTGMFGADNPDFVSDAGGNPIRVDRHIVFLTDGEMTATYGNYSAFGIPSRSDRMTGCAGASSESCLESKHRARFISACNRARTMATVWVIALDVGSTADIAQCATSPNHFFVSNGSNLDTVFTSIGRGIGKLRVVK